MYCPRCGEQQNSGNLRFCSKCGLPLGLVSEVLSNGGTLPQLTEISQNKGFLTRKNGIFFSILWFFLFVLIITPISGVLNLDDLAGISALLGVMGSLLILLFSVFFLTETPQGLLNQTTIQNNNTIPQNLGGQQTRRNVLPPQETQAARDFVAPPNAASWKTYDTGELVQPGSVTEGTTKLLKKELEEEDTKYFDKNI